MKVWKLLLCALLSVGLVSNVWAGTYSDGDIIQDELGYIEVPEDSSYIKFTLPQGTYPSESKAVLYAQYNVFCYIPGVEYTEPTADANPYKIAAEVVFTDEDIANLAKGEVTFTADLKFDIQCGAIKVQIVSTKKKSQNNLVDENRESGASEDETGKTLTTYSHGSTFDGAAKLSGNVLKFTIPQGSYTLGDYIIIAKDNVIVKDITITKDMMNTLVNANIEYSIITDFEDAENIEFVISSYTYDIGDLLNEDIEISTESDVATATDVDTPTKNSGGVSPIIFGIITFVIVVAGGLIYGFIMDKQKKEKAKRAAARSGAVVPYTTNDQAHQIEDSRIVEAEVVDKSDDDSKDGEGEE